MAIYSGFSHWKWWFSIVMLVYQRVIFPLENPPLIGYFPPTFYRFYCRRVISHEITIKIMFFHHHWNHIHFPMKSRRIRLYKFLFKKMNRITLYKIPFFLSYKNQFLDHFLVGFGLFFRSPPIPRATAEKCRLWRWHCHAVDAIAHQRRRRHPEKITTETKTVFFSVFEFVCIYLSIYICVYLYIYTYLSNLILSYILVYLSICLSIHPSVHPSIHLCNMYVHTVHTYIGTYVHMYACMHACNIDQNRVPNMYIIYIYIRLNMYVYIYMYMYMYVYINMYIHIQLYTHTILRCFETLESFGKPPKMRLGRH